MDESTLLTHVCADFTLSGRMTMQSQEDLQEEKSYSGSESEMKWIRMLTALLTASLLVSSALIKLLPNLLAETL